MNENKSKRLSRQNWLDYFKGAIFLEVYRQSDFLDAMLTFLKDHNLEDFILRDFCRVFNIKQASSDMELRNSHEFYEYMVSVREALIDRRDLLLYEPQENRSELQIILPYFGVIVGMLFLFLLLYSLDLGMSNTLLYIGFNVMALTTTIMNYKRICFRRDNDKQVPARLTLAFRGGIAVLFVGNIMLFPF